MVDASYRCKRLYRPNSADGGCPARADMKGLTAESYFGFDVSRRNAVNGTLYLDNEDDASGDASGGTLWAEIQCGPSANSVDCYNSSNGYVKSARATTSEQQGRQVASCMDIVVGVKYEVLVTDAGRIETVSVSFEYQSFAAEVGVERGQHHAFFVDQSHSVTFIRPLHPDAVQPTTDTLLVDKYPRSGNPGYIRGKPVLAGKRRLLGADSEQSFVMVAEDPSTWIFFPKADSTGSCPVDSSTYGGTGVPPAASRRMSISYGYDGASSCVFELKLADFKDCSAIREEVYSAVNAITSRAEYVGRYGMSSQTVIEDWVEVINTDPPQPPASDATDESTFECSPVITGAHLEILTAKIGAQANPQDTIVGAVWTYSTSLVTFSCVGNFCMAGSAAETQKLSVRYSVSFVDVTEEASPVYAKTPSIIKKRPYDFFYPFA